MSVKSKLVMSAAALALAGGLGAAGTLPAHAATAKCGQGCIDWFSPAFGTAAHPGFVLQAPSPAKAGQAVTLTAASTVSTGEDFYTSQQGLVRDFVKVGLINDGLEASYGGNTAIEVEYAPGGSASGLCVGVGTTNPGAGTAVTLQACGQNAKTVWILDPVTTKTGTFNALISAATTSDFGHPAALTALMPRMPLSTTPLASSTSAALLGHQLWGYLLGALPAS
jgi:hypothetical protein